MLRSYTVPPFEKGGLRGFKMLKYNPDLKQPSRHLRSDMTDAEQALWARLRRKQIMDIQFYRQKPIGQYIVDFYAPKVHLVVEVDGGGHFEEAAKQYDKRRTIFLQTQGLTVLRFNNLEVLRELDAVVLMIWEEVKTRLDVKIPPSPPFLMGGTVAEPNIHNLETASVPLSKKSSLDELI